MTRKKSANETGQMTNSGGSWPTNQASNEKSKSAVREFPELSKVSKPKVPVKIWLMLGLVILFALLLSYFLVIGIYPSSGR